MKARGTGRKKSGFFCGGKSGKVAKRQITKSPKHKSVKMPKYQNTKAPPNGQSNGQSPRLFESALASACFCASRFGRPRP